MTGRSPGWSSLRSPWTGSQGLYVFYSYFSSINPNKSPINYLWICFKFTDLLKFENQSSNLIPRRILTRRVRFCGIIVWYPVESDSEGSSTPWNQIPRSLIPLVFKFRRDWYPMESDPMGLRPRGIRFREVWKPLGIGFQLTRGIRSCGVWDPVSDGLKELTSAGSLPRGLIHCWTWFCGLWYPVGSDSLLGLIPSGISHVANGF